MSERTPAEKELIARAALAEIRRTRKYLDQREKKALEYLAKIGAKISPVNLSLQEEAPDEYPAEFEQIWAWYPARNGFKREKKAAFTKWRGMKAQDKELVRKAVQNYARSDEAKRMPRDMVRFFKSDFWPAWISPSQAMLQGSNDKNNPNQQRPSGAAAAVEKVLHGQQIRG